MIARWIPRDGAAPLAIFVHDKALGTYDPSTSAVTEWKKPDSGYPREVTQAIAHERHEGVIDHRWTSLESGALRGWSEGGEIVTVSAAGDLQRSAFHYAHAVTTGPRALTATGTGTFFQSTDHGETWAEVAPPPLAGKGRNTLPHHCSPVGCDFNVWMRLGWDASPPAPVAEGEPLPHAPPTPRIARTPLRELSCTPLGGERFTQTPSAPVSPEDYGFGARHVPSSTTVKDEALTYRKRTLSRGLVNPPYGITINDIERAARAMVHGWAAEFTMPPDPRVAFGGITVLGPTRTAEAFKREIAFLEPFDPEGAVRQVSFGLRDVAAAVRAAGEPLGQLFASEGPDLDGMVTILPLDPTGAIGLAVSMPADAGQVLGTISGGSSPRLKLAGMRLDPNITPVVSAVELAGGETALLMIASDNTTEVDKLDASGVSLLYHVNALPQQYAPANPDALAVNATGTLAILRTASGADPPTARDPALLIPVGQGPVLTLAPWSTLTLADDPACRADTSGYRAVVQTISPWVRVRGSSPPRNGTSGAMSARVRWSATRVCLEAIEIPDIGKATRNSDEIETEIVARFTGKPAAARIGIAAGAEVRQPLSCTLLPP